MDRVHQKEAGSVAGEPAALVPSSEPPSSPPAPSPPEDGEDRKVVLYIKPSKGWVSLNLGELWEYRELLYFFTWRDIKVRYTQTVLGAAWAILQPFMTMLVFSLFFGKLAGIPSDNIPYPLFAYAALVPWTFFATGVTQGSNSLVGGSKMLKKIYFPRMAMPVAAVLAGGVDFVLASLVLVLMMTGYILAGYEVVPTAHILCLPYFLLLALASSLGAALWLSAMNVQFRDIRYTVPFIVQFWMFSTPIAYPSSLIESDALRMVYAVNPMVGVIDGCRWALLNTDTAPGYAIIVSTLSAFLLLASGAFFFLRMERTFADVV
jgi:lipopolysaccharide transport system permease protein